MFIGRVVGSVWSTVKWPELEGVKLLTVQPYHLSELVGGSGPAEQPVVCDDLVVCADALDAGIGDDVVIAYGHAARVALHRLKKRYGDRIRAEIADTLPEEDGEGVEEELSRLRAAIAR